MFNRLIRALRQTSITTRAIVLAVVLLLPMAATSAYVFWTVQRASGTLDEARRIATISEIVTAVHMDFHELLYWRADLAVSLLTLSEQRGNEARARLDAELERHRAAIGEHRDEMGGPYADAFGDRGDHQPMAPACLDAQGRAVEQDEDADVSQQADQRGENDQSDVVLVGRAFEHVEHKAPRNHGIGFT